MKRASFIVILIVTIFSLCIYFPGNAECSDLSHILKADYELPQDALRALVIAHSRFEVELKGRCDTYIGHAQPQLCKPERYSVAIYRYQDSFIVYFFPEKEFKEGSLGVSVALQLDVNYNIIDITWDK
jgi:hypothetical protein